MDATMQSLKRRVAGGDPQAQRSLDRAHDRAGVCRIHPEQLLRGKTRFCRVCKALRKADLARERWIKEIVNTVYGRRQNRSVHPDGDFDKAGRWYPSDEEDQGDVTCNVRSPSRTWPYSYMLRARTKQHCRVLVEAALAGKDVPGDVASAVSRARASEPEGVAP